MTEIIPIVENDIMFSENISRISDYFEREITIDNLNNKYNFYWPQVNHFQPIYDEVQELLGLQLSSDVIDKVVNQGLYHRSINPTFEVVELLKTILESPDQRPENCVIIAIKYKKIIIGSISVTVDPRTTIDDQKVAYFIGIRKSASLLAAQQYQSELSNFKLSEMIIPAVEEYGRKLGARYLVTTPLINMSKILREHYGFQGPSLNMMTHRYEPPAFIMGVPDEIIVWKKMSSDEKDQEQNILPDNHPLIEVPFHDMSEMMTISTFLNGIRGSTIQ